MKLKKTTVSKGESEKPMFIQKLKECKRVVLVADLCGAQINIDISKNKLQKHLNDSPESKISWRYSNHETLYVFSNEANPFIDVNLQHERQTTTG